MNGIKRIVLLGMATFALIVAAPAGAATVTEFELPSKSISSLAQAPDGTILYSATHRDERPGAPLDGDSGFVGRVGPNGPIGEEAVPPAYPGQIAVGTEGTAWFANGEAIARLAPGAQWTPVAGVPKSAERITASAGGGVWFAASGGGSSSVGRISADGGVTSWSVPDRGIVPSAIVEGREGDAWFSQFFAERIGRVTPSGQVTEYPLPKGTMPQDLAVDDEGDVWFSALKSIGRITPAGKVALYRLPKGVSPGKIAFGPDGRIWFTESYKTPKAKGETVPRTLGRIDPDGHYSEVVLPNSASDPVDLIAGAEGNVWYAAMGEPPCEGGGTHCLLFQPPNPAIVGRVAVGPQRAKVGAGSVVASPDRAYVSVACEEGKLGQSCRGTVSVKVGGRIVGRGRYVVPVDHARQSPAKRLGQVGSLLALTAKHRRAVVVLHPDHGSVVRRAVALDPAR